MIKKPFEHYSKIKKMNNLKLLSVKQVGENQFEVIISKNEIPKTYIVIRETFFLESMGEEMAVYQPEDLELSEIWGTRSFGIGREISPKIRELVEASKLQTV